MNRFHLSNEALQDFLLDPNALDAEGRQHLNGCPECQAALRAYSVLFGDLQGLPPELPDFDTASWVMDAIPEKQPVRPGYSYDWILLLSGFLVAGIPVFLLRKNLQQLFLGITPLVLFCLAGLSVLILCWRAAAMYRDFRKRVSSLNFN